MLRRGMKAGALVAMLVVGLTVPAWAGSAVIGSVAGSLNATVGGQALVPNTTLFSGDSVTVKDGAAVVAMGNGSRMVFGRETVVSFLREGNEVTVLLGQGNVSLYHPVGGVEVRVKAGEIVVAPTAGYKTLGEVAMIGGAVMVTTKEGMLRVEGNGTPVEVAKGKTMTVVPRVARAPQGGAAGAGAGTARMSSATALQVAAVGTGLTSTVLSGVAISRSNDARDAAVLANATAAQSVAAAQAAEDAANAAAQAANDVGCALNAYASPAQPYGGTCP